MKTRPHSLQSTLFFLTLISICFSHCSLNKLGEKCPNIYEKAELTDDDDYLIFTIQVEPNEKVVYCQPYNLKFRADVQYQNEDGDKDDIGDFIIVDGKKVYKIKLRIRNNIFSDSIKARVRCLASEQKDSETSPTLLFHHKNVYEIEDPRDN